MAARRSHPLSWEQVLAKMTGKELVGRTYEPLFPYFADLKQQGAFRWGLGQGWQGLAGL